MCIAKQSNKISDWLGINTLPDFTKARWLGGLISVVGTILIVGFVGLVFYEFFLALTGMGGFEDTVSQSAAIRNIGLVVAAIIGVPFVIWRTVVAQKQAHTANEALFNEKIIAASADLHATRQRWDDNLKQNIWEDDIVRRNVAIDRLKGLANERKDVALRISMMLSVYVRELSKEHPPVPPPKDMTLIELRAWARNLTVVRSDMENATQVLGRLTKSRGVNSEDIVIDLREANLQGFDLKDLNFQAAKLTGAQLQGAMLLRTNMQQANLELVGAQWANFGWADMKRASISLADMQGANLTGAKLQRVFFIEAQMQQVDLTRADLRGASLLSAKMQGADLSFADLQEAYFDSADMQAVDLTGAKMQGTNFGSAKMQGVNLVGVKVSASTSLEATSLRGAALKLTDYSDLILSQLQIDETFYDGSVTLPKGLTRAIDRDETLEISKFLEQWHVFPNVIDFDPDDSSTWDSPNAE
ncbi:pentapeptide repeat-containing protein [Tropicibacter sp. Alg240-R139]|uniref:pentapeptide repeat-containing protein n=1 Tax=Tropicibacter sp. Alg240-R139 TaxID=2305991 RepID=UPI0013DF645D|nr:pentapeptide repeat-containing protein [Tropicibacter sp. Alg240-R139]